MISAAREYAAIPPEALARLVAIIEARAVASDPSSSAWDDALEARELARAAVVVSLPSSGVARD